MARKEIQIKARAEHVLDAGSLTNLMPCIIMATHIVPGDLSR